MSIVRDLLKRTCILKGRKLSTVDAVFLGFEKLSMGGIKTTTLFSLVRICAEYHYHASFESVSVYRKIVFQNLKSALVGAQ